MENNNILNGVKNYKSCNPVRFHMPGHKGRPLGDFLDPVFPYDVTELPDTGNMLEPEGPAKGSLNFARELYGTETSLYSSGGATLALQTAIATVCSVSGNSRIICGRLAHKSVISAMALCGAEPVWFDSFAGPPSLPSGDAAAVLVTSPDYYGRMADIAAIAGETSRRGIPLIVDNSHGAHLWFYSDGELHPLKNGADIVIDSLHKTLPSLTGSALLHLTGSFGCTGETALRSMRMFASTSPSFLINASIDRALISMKASGKTALDKLLAEIDIVKAKLALLGAEFADFPRSDPFRITFRTASAKGLYNFLLNRGVVCEFADRYDLVLIPSVMNTTDDFADLYEGCAGFGCLEPAPELQYDALYLPERALSPRDAMFSPGERINVRGAEGRICAEPASPYPPGVPVIAPGERFDRTVIDILEENGIHEVYAVRRG